MAQSKKMIKHILVTFLIALTLIITFEKTTQAAIIYTYTGSNLVINDINATTWHPTLTLTFQDNLPRNVDVINSLISADFSLGPGYPSLQLNPQPYISWFILSNTLDPYYAQLVFFDSVQYPTFVLRDVSLLAGGPYNIRPTMEIGYDITDPWWSENLSSVGTTLNIQAAHATPLPAALFFFAPGLIGLWSWRRRTQHHLINECSLR